MKCVKVDEGIWGMIVAHYAELRDPTPDDEKVMWYIIDKEGRRMAHDAYMSQRRIDNMATDD